MFLLLKILFLPIWLPFKIIAELIEHSGRSRRSRSRTYPSRPGTRRGNPNGCLVVLVVIVVVGGIGAIAQSCSGGTARPAAHHPSASAAPSAASASPSGSTSSAAASASAPQSPPASATPAASQSAPSAPACHPLTDGGNCYEPGEFCRYSDEGKTGVAGDGESIKCEDNNGWRWEPI